MNQADGSSRGKWLALAAALLGWMFDGLEQGLFPLVARPSLRALGAESEAEVAKWLGVATACFLLGAATGGVLFGWLGDRLGRIRAMTLSVLTYSIFSGLCGFATSAEQIAALRFLSALGMGGEWSLGVALVMEIWPDKSRAFLAGLIGAAANVGFLLIGAIGGLVTRNLESVGTLLASTGMSEQTTDWLTRDAGWRFVMLLGAVPALLTFFIRLFVPESHSWEKQQSRGTTAHWSARDLLGIAIGAVGVVGILFLWTLDMDMPLRIAGSVLALAVAGLGYLYPVLRYVQRLTLSGLTVPGKPIRRMLLGACLSGVPLLVTWASVLWSPTWADKLTRGDPQARANTQMCSALGAIIGTIAGALLGDRLGRRNTYFLLCAGSLAISQYHFRGHDTYGPLFLVSMFATGMLTASFYGWLPLYLPELFSSGMRATGQGFSYNFGRILAAIGVLQTGFLMKEIFKDDYPGACASMSFMYLVGMILIWLAPETRGKPLPE